MFCSISESHERNPVHFGTSRSIFRQTYLRNHDFLERLIIGIFFKKLLAKGADFEGRFMPVQKKKRNFGKILYLQKEQQSAKTTLR